MQDFPSEDLEKMVYEAVGISEIRKDKLISEVKKPKSIVMAISEKKIRPK